MATQILMPKLGLTMTEGTIAEWVASAGATVNAGDVDCDPTAASGTVTASSSTTGSASS